MRTFCAALSFVGLTALGTGGFGCSSEDELPGAPVTTSLSNSQRQELEALKAQLDAVKNLDAAGFAAKYQVPFSSEPLGYDPRTAKGLTTIAGSSFALDAPEQDALAARGFLLTEKKRFPTFIYGYQSIYAQDLPVYVSADSILYAIHESYDAILAATERDVVVPTLARMLNSMRTGLQGAAAAGLSAEARRDVDLYLAVALTLLVEHGVSPVAGASDAEIKALAASAVAASGASDIELFGVRRTVDFSQFTVRGHYTESPALQRYFRAAMWLGRIDLRLIETQPDHTQRFHRRQLEAAYAIRAAMDASALADWRTIDTIVGGFVGEHDNMIVPQLDELLLALGLDSPTKLSQRTDDEIASAITSGGFGTQRIASHLMKTGIAERTMPLSSTFMLLGQRYVIDSHVFSNVVHDRVQRNGPLRLMPNPLDVGFAALKNDQAGLLLGSELAKFLYAPDLASMRIIADAHPSTFWRANLYNEWLSALQTLSPSGDIANAGSGLPAVARTEPWGRRLLNAQLASWAELRRDTILYAKQSYSASAVCDYPDAYVDPYPQFYAAIARFASRGAALVATPELAQSPTAAKVATYFNGLQTVASTLEAMATNQRSGAPHTAEHLAFINSLTFQHNPCAASQLMSFDGWYARLFFNPEHAIELDPVVADVHTQPTDEQGTTVGKVLHVGTGMPRTMIVTVNTCTGPHAYVGLVSSYYEHTTGDFDRLTDERWSAKVAGAPNVPWMSDLLTH